GRFIRVIGRLAPGATLAGARSEMTTIAARLQLAYPETNRERNATVTGLAESSTRSARPALAVLGGAVGFLLLIACLNVATPPLLAGTARRRELAVRAALGASRGRLVALLVWESALLAAAGGAVGVALALWGLPAVAALSPGGISRLEQAGVDAAVVGFAVACTFAAAVASGVLPPLSVVAAPRPGASPPPPAPLPPP